MMAIDDDEARRQKDRDRVKQHRKDHLSRHEIRSAFNKACRILRKYSVSVVDVFGPDGIGFPPDGDWHLDHIHPLSLFDSGDSRHVQAAWHRENLQWLPARQNRSKSDKHCIEEAGAYFRRWGIRPVINSKKKGNKWENVCLKRLEAVYGEKTVMQGRQVTKGHDIPDLICRELVVECKVGKAINLRRALEQCERDSKVRQLDQGRYCVVYAKYDGEQPMALMRLDDFEDLIRTRMELAER